VRTLDVELLTGGVEARLLLQLVAHGLGDIDVLLGDLALAGTDGVPPGVVDDPKLGYFGYNPLRLGVEPRHTLAGRGILKVAEPVPDQAPDIELIVYEAGAALDVAADRRVAPERLKRVAMSAWSRLIRSSASASMRSNCPACAS
jgi:hypothetical protein